jgi:hypothetical protein
MQPFPIWPLYAVATAAAGLLLLAIITDLWT